MRLGEIFRLKRKDINKEGCYIHITRSKTDDKQDEPGRKVPLTDSVEKTIDYLERIVGDISPEKEIFGKWNASALQATWRDVKRRARENAPEGALKEKMIKEPSRFHDLRHAAVSLFQKLDGSADRRDCRTYLAGIDLSVYPSS
jgi:integrase